MDNSFRARAEPAAAHFTPQSSLPREPSPTSLLTATAALDALQERLNFAVGVEKGLFILCRERHNSEKPEENS